MFTAMTEVEVQITTTTQAVTSSKITTFTHIIYYATEQMYKTDTGYVLHLSRAVCMRRPKCSVLN